MRRGGAAKGTKKGSKKQKNVIPEEDDDALENEDEMALMDQANMGGIDQEQLTAEQKEKPIIKTLVSANPQAPHNICQFSYKDRHFKMADRVDQLYFHFSSDGYITLKDSDDYRLQEEYWDTKKRTNKKLLDNMNQAVISELGEDPLADNDAASKKSLRNQFNF